jgi:hypothetical protein
MSFKRDFAEAVLSEIVGSIAENRTRNLRGSVRWDPPGAYSNSKQALGRAGDAISEDPGPVVELLEAWWDSPKRRHSRR